MEALLWTFAILLLVGGIALKIIEKISEKDKEEDDPHGYKEPKFHTMTEQGHPFLADFKAPDMKDMGYETDKKRYKQFRGVR